LTGGGGGGRVRKTTHNVDKKKQSSVTCGWDGEGGGVTVGKREESQKFETRK